MTRDELIKKILVEVDRLKAEIKLLEQEDRSSGQAGRLGEARSRMSSLVRRLEEIRNG